MPSFHVAIKGASSGLCYQSSQSVCRVADSDCAELGRSAGSFEVGIAGGVLYVPEARPSIETQRDEVMSQIVRVKTVGLRGMQCMTTHPPQRPDLARPLPGSMWQVVAEGRELRRARRLLTCAGLRVTQVGRALMPGRQVFRVLLDDLPNVKTAVRPSQPDAPPGAPATERVPSA